MIYIWIDKRSRNGAEIDDRRDANDGAQIETVASCRVFDVPELATHPPSASSPPEFPSTQVPPVIDETRRPFDKHDLVVQAPLLYGVLFPKRRTNVEPGKRKLGALPTRKAVYTLLRRIDWERANKALDRAWL